MRQAGYAPLFLTQFFRHPRRVGSLMPSSSSLARSMVPLEALPTANLVVELGPGTGVITGELIRLMPAHCQYLGVELNESFLRILRRRFPNQVFHHGNADALAKILRGFGYDKADIIVSSLPLTTLPYGEVVSSIHSYASCLANTGTFSTFIYCHNVLMRRNRRIIRCLTSMFSDTEVERVFANFPPALTLRSRTLLDHCPVSSIA